MKSSCIDGHEMTLRSSENVRDDGRAPAKVNVDLSSSVLLSGMTYATAQVNNFFRYVNKNYFPEFFRHY